MNVRHQEEEAGPVHVRVAEQPAGVDVAHDQLVHRSERAVRRRIIMHREDDSGDDLDGQEDPGEDAETAARRECHEELALIAGETARLGEMWPLPGYCTEYMTFFRITGARQPGPGDPEAHKDADEDIETQAFTLAQVRQMVMDGDIKDLKTAAALVWLEQVRDR